jgi:hypothetical protein
MVIMSGTDYWQALLGSPLLQRVGPAPAYFLDYFTLVNALTGVPHRLRAASVTADFAADVRCAIDEMPAVVKERLEPKLLGIFFVGGLGSTGVTDIVLRENGEALGSVVLLDVESLVQRTANEWATWKENMPFSPAHGITVKTSIAEPVDDNRKNAIQHLLLHEFGHVLSAGEAFVPDWWLGLPNLPGDRAYPFLSLAWQIADGRSVVPIPPNDFPRRERIDYYTGARLSGDDACDIYAALQASSFPSLYAATNVYDDFAESFAIYVHSILMKRPLETFVLRDGEPVAHLDAGSRSGRCREKFAFMARYLESGN